MAVKEPGTDHVFLLRFSARGRAGKRGLSPNLKLTGAQRNDEQKFA